MHFSDHISQDSLAHRGQDIEKCRQLMFFTTDGILGTPISVSATFIFVFLLFGAFLVKTGVGEYFNDLAVVFAGHLIGGPAKVAIFSVLCKVQFQEVLLQMLLHQVHIQFQ